MSAIPYEWDGEVMRPRPGFGKRCDALFVIGQTYPLAIEESRSWASHGHYFAVLNEAWTQLPETVASRLVSVEHMRKFALIRTGHRDERSIVAASKAEAQRLASFVKPMDDFALVDIEGATVTVYTAKSQSVRAMGKAAFQRSKQDVLDYVATLIGVAPDALAANAGRAA